jgi:hypothetical protein
VRTVPPAPEGNGPPIGWSGAEAPLACKPRSGNTDEGELPPGRLAEGRGAGARHHRLVRIPCLAT